MKCKVLSKTFETHYDLGVCLKQRLEVLDLHLCSTNGSDPDESHLTSRFLTCKMDLNHFTDFRGGLTNHISMPPIYTYIYNQCPIHIRDYYDY